MTLKLDRRDVWISERLKQQQIFTTLHLLGEAQGSVLADAKLVLSRAVLGHPFDTRSEASRRNQQEGGPRLYIQVAHGLVQNTRVLENFSKSKKAQKVGPIDRDASPPMQGFFADKNQSNTACPREGTHLTGLGRTGTNLGAPGASACPPFDEPALPPLRNASIGPREFLRSEHAVEEETPIFASLSTSSSSIDIALVTEGNREWTPVNSTFGTLFPFLKDVPDGFGADPFAEEALAAAAAAAAVAVALVVAVELKTTPAFETSPERGSDPELFEPHAGAELVEGDRGVRSDIVSSSVSMGVPAPSSLLSLLISSPPSPSDADTAML